MMKKFIVVLVVLAIAGISSMAFAADISVSGDMFIRSRDFQDMSMNKDKSNNTVDTQEKLRLNVNVKSDNVKAKISIENDWDTWGRFEAYQGNGTTTQAGQSGFLRLREAWMSVNIPGLPLNLTGGHQLLQLGQGWFFRSTYYGSDAWVLANVTGNNTAAFVNVKVFEGLAGNSDDVDAYVLLDVVKIDENNTVGIDVTMANDRDNTLKLGGTTGTKESQAQNIGLNYVGKLGPVGLKAEADLQMGKAKQNDAKFKGNQIIVQGNVAMDPANINFAVARGSGKSVTDSSADHKEIVTFLDINQHYTFLYEYKIAGPCGIHTGFCDTTALNVGAMVNVSKSVAVGGDIWWLQASEKVNDTKSTTGGTTKDLGTEIDLKLNWKMYDNLSWNWVLGYLSPGNGLGKDAALGAQGVLALSF